MLREEKKQNAEKRLDNEYILPYTELTAARMSSPPSGFALICTKSVRVFRLRRSMFGQGGGGVKAKRQAMILSIISEKQVATQNQLLMELEKAGFPATQTTVSRDLEALHIRRAQQADGSRRYVRSLRKDLEEQEGRLYRVFAKSVSSYQAAQNLVVIHTLPGLAGAVAGALDSMALPKVLGTIAGDDTVFAALPDRAAAEEFCRLLSSLL